MSRRTIVLALVAVALGGVLLASRYLRFGIAPQGAALAGAAQPRALDPSVAERLARIDGRLRLPPDRRALAAVGEIRALVHGGAAKAAKPAEASYASGSWKIAYEGERVGMLSSFPRFAALVSLLDEWAARERTRPGAVKLREEREIRPELQGRLNRFDDVAAFEVLAEVDARWRERSASVGDLLAATDALAQLCAILPRDSAPADRLTARALASLALARQYAAERTLRAEITLAFATGYATHARTLAEGLPREEPLAAFARADLAALERAARPSDASHVDPFYSARLLWWRGGDAWLSWYREQPEKRASRLAVVGTALDDRSAPTGQVVPELYAAALLGRFDLPSRGALTRCDALSEKLESSARRFSGPFADSALYAESYRAACVAALYRKLAFFTAAAGQPESALELARSLPEHTRADLSALRDWTERMTGEGARGRDTAAVAQALANPALGEEAREQLARRTLAALAPEDPRRRDLADAAAAALDSRASGRLFAGELARDVYLDPDLEERCLAAAADLYGAEQAWLVSQVAGFRRDWQALWSIVETDASRFEERMAALEELEQQRPLEADRLRRAYENLLVAHADSEALRRQLARFLEKGLGDRRAARNVLLPILAAHPQHDLASDEVAATVARLHLEDGHTDEAWALLEPRLASPAVAPIAARAQLALGNLPRAEEIARAAWERDPSSLPTTAELAAVLWEAGRNAEAAQVIAKLPARASDADRCWHLCRAFARTFKGRPAADAAAAFRELGAAKLDPELLQGLLELFRSTARPETTLALADDSASIPVVEGYKTLKAARGEAEALRWLATRIPRERLGAAAASFYFHDADELLWKLIDDPDQDKQGGSATWLLRAAAFARERDPDPAHREALVAYFGAHQTTADEQLGAALVGLSDTDALLANARSEGELGKAAYFLGARAESARDFHGAVRLYQLALSSPRGTQGHDLARDAMSRIQGLDTSLDALARERPSAAVVASGR